MLNLNHFSFTGRLTRDPEMKYLQDGKAVTNISVAINNPRMVGGEWKSETVFMDVATFDKTAERAGELNKGDGVYIEGKIKQDNWEKDGVKHSKIKVTASVIKPMKDAESGQSGRSAKVNAGNYEQQSGPQPSDALFGGEDDNDLPF